MGIFLSGCVIGGCGQLEVAKPDQKPVVQKEKERKKPVTQIKGIERSIEKKARAGLTSLKKPEVEFTKDFPETIIVKKTKKKVDLKAYLVNKKGQSPFVKKNEDYTISMLGADQVNFSKEGEYKVAVVVKNKAGKKVRQKRVVVKVVEKESKEKESSKIG